MIHTSENIIELTVFKVGEIICGVDNKQVKEINKESRITPVHKAPEYIRGVVNIRGQIVTIVDLRVKFDLKSIAITNTSRFVIMDMEGEYIGLLVDTIEDNIIGDNKNVELPPSNLGGVNGSFFSGVYKLENSLVGIINVANLLRIEAAN